MRSGLFDTVANWDVQARYADGLPLHFMRDRVARDIVGKMGEDGWISVSRGARASTSRAGASYIRGCGPCRDPGGGPARTCSPG